MNMSSRNYYLSFLVCAIGSLPHATSITLIVLPDIGS
jgi:hypothetical protein